MTPDDRDDDKKPGAGSQRDDELDQLLEPLRREPPTELELRRWEAALDAAEARGGARRPARRWLAAWQLLAACVLGALAGSWLLAQLRPAAPCANAATRQLAVENNAPDATIERIHIKLD
jgi:hypothetical protein